MSPRRAGENTYGDWVDWLLCLGIAIFMGRVVVSPELDKNMETAAEKKKIISAESLLFGGGDLHLSCHHNTSHELR